MVELGVTFSLTQLIIDNEIVKMVKKVVRGIPLSDESMATEVINQAGPGGSFVEKEHTFKHMREQSQPELIDRRTRERWKSSGGRDLAQKAHEKALTILKSHKPEPLTKEMLSDLRLIVEEAEKISWKKKGN